MNHFENNTFESITGTEAIHELTMLTGIACENAVMVAGGEVELGEIDAACMWMIIGLCEGVLGDMPAGAVERGFEIANKRINREVRARAAEKSFQRLYASVFGGEN